MRIWTLLAKHVLLGKTKGYTNHPQLERFKRLSEPLQTIDAYLEQLYLEAETRGYKFDKNKFESNKSVPKISVMEGQVVYELEHLRKKLESRAPQLLINLPESLEQVELHSLFELVPGGVEDWERVG